MARKTTTKQAIGQWIATVTAIILLAGGCLGGVMLVFGGGSYQRAAGLEASSLADAEVSELVGTTQYMNTPTGQQHSLLSAISTTFHLPFTNPLSMLTSEFPATLQPFAPSGESQSSLFNYITAWASTNHKIALGWATSASTGQTEQLLLDNPGINVLSPSWLSLTSGSGTVQNNVEPAVVTFAHQRHVQVWALIDNSVMNPNNQQMTHACLSNPAATQSLINSIVQIATTDHLDGINVDFENMATADRDAFTDFIARLHAKLAPAHIDLSVDITPDIIHLDDDAAYFHAGLADDCDQVILMAYDEHWSTDPTPGPVADVPWVTQSVYDLLDTGVPTDKLLLGLPFYTEFWHVQSDGTVSAEPTASSAVNGILNLHHAIGTWDPNLGLMYAKYAKPDGYEEVWYATQRTLEEKLALVNQLGLGGVAVWSLQMSNQQTWSNLVQALRQSVT